jgi:phosphoglycerate dehydrogenase-like enzyme
MKICISDSTFQAFKETFTEAFPNQEFLLIDGKGKLITGEGTPEVAFLSYEIMFKALADPDYKDNYLKIINGCEYIQGSWAGIESDLAQEIITKTKIFSHGGGLHAIPIANYVFAQMLRSIKSIDAHIELQKEKKWEQMMSVGELTDMVIGITGFGGIGQEVARLAKAFGMVVYATKRTPVASDNLDRLFRATEIDEMLPLCDFIVNCLPASEETFKIFSKQQFSLMKPSAMFINVGRGESVDEDALAHALSSEEILCAALDTTYPEPLDQSSPLWTLKNCFISPHDSAWGPRAPERAVDLFLDNFKKYINGDKLLNQV